MEEDWPPPELEWRFLRLHVETAIALQIGLATGEFRAGQYSRGEGYNAWKRDEAQNPRVRRPSSGVDPSHIK